MFQLIYSPEKLTLACIACLCLYIEKPKKVLAKNFNEKNVRCNNIWVTQMAYCVIMLMTI